jgi:lipopolysaccharide/colanic/teichoic acid biosynthesis glycosyltransferase
VLERGEKIEVLREKTKDMEEKAVVFRKNASKAKRFFWCQNMKMTLLLIFIVLAIIGIIIGLICGSGNC